MQQVEAPRITVTKLARHEPEGERPYHTARVTINGTTREFHDRFGSWMTDRRRSDNWPASIAMREASPAVARALAKKARRADKRKGVWKGGQR